VENMPIVAVENRCLVILNEVVHADSTVDLPVFLSRLLIDCLVDILKGVSSKSLQGADASLFVVDAVTLLEVIDKHLQATQSEEEKDEKAHFGCGIKEDSEETKDNVCSQGG
jgi:hypothetical protein